MEEESKKEPSIGKLTKTQSAASTAKDLVNFGHHAPNRRQSRSQEQLDFLRSYRYFLYAARYLHVFRDHFLKRQLRFKFITENIKKGGCDKRSYRYILLNNNLRCMLVSDDQTQTSAATLVVSSGNLNDPKGLDGLAHFCEHMLFMGTEKHPSENHYSKFIVDNGGKRNGMTSEDATQFYFEIKNDKFEQALGIFAEFFKTPLFNQDCVEREMKAVDSEFRKNLSNELRRYIQVLKTELSHKNSPLRGFGTGNFETLNVPHVRDYMIKYYQENYSSNIMSCCLVGNHSLDSLQEMAISNFSSIEEAKYPSDRTKIADKRWQQLKHEAMKPHFKSTKKFTSLSPPQKQILDTCIEAQTKQGDMEPLFGQAIERKNYVDTRLYDDSVISKLVIFVPAKDQKVLQLTWPHLPDKRHQWRTKPSRYLSHTIGHEGRHSLKSELIRQGYVTSCDAGGGSRLHDCVSSFNITTSLTDKGLENWQEVIRIIFAFINQIRRQGVQTYVMKESEKMAEIALEFSGRKSAFTTSEKLAGVLSAWRGPESGECKIEDIMYSTLSKEVGDPEDITKILNLLVPQTCMFQLRAKKFENDLDLRTEHYYGAKFKVVDIPKATIDIWAEALPKGDEDLGVAPENIFIPQKLELKNVPLPPDGNPATPRLIQGQNPNESQVWFKQDDQFEQPYIFAVVKIFSTDNDFPQNINAKVFISLWQSMFNEHSRELKYTAQLAGIVYDMTQQKNSFGFKLLAYNDSYYKFFAQVFKEIETFQPTQSFYEDKRKGIIRGFKNSLLCEPHVRASGLGSELLSKQWTHEELLDSIEKMDFQLFLSLKRNFLKNLEMVWLITGHLDRQQALQIVQTAESTLKYKRISEEDAQRDNRCVKLRDRTVYSLDRDNAMAENPNSACRSIWQAEPISSSENLSEACQILIALLKEPVFNTLRTKEQLGYIVTATKFNVQKVVHFAITVQSNSYDAYHLEHRINTFIESLKEWQPTEQQVADAKASAVNALRQKTTSLGAEANIFWGHICAKEFDFDMREQKIEKFEKLTAADIQSIFRRVFFQNPRRINVRVHSHQHNAKAENSSENQALNEQHYTNSDVYDGNTLAIQRIESIPLFQMQHGQHPRM